VCLKFLQVSGAFQLPEWAQIFRTPLQDKHFPLRPLKVLHHRMRTLCMVWFVKFQHNILKRIRFVMVCVWELLVSKLLQGRRSNMGFGTSDWGIFKSWLK